MLKEQFHKLLDQILDGPCSYEKSLLIATLAHAGQRDKGGAPYIQHPIAVSDPLKTEDEKSSGLLHDVVEDTFVTLNDLEDLGYSMYQIATIDAITKRDGEDYKDYIKRVKKVPTAVEIKISDIKHNLDLNRIKNADNLQDKDLKRYKKYVETLQELGN